METGHMGQIAVNNPAYRSTLHRDDNPVATTLFHHFPLARIGKYEGITCSQTSFHICDDEIGV